MYAFMQIFDLYVGFLLSNGIEGTDKCLAFTTQTAAQRVILEGSTPEGRLLAKQKVLEALISVKRKALAVRKRYFYQRQKSKMYYGRRRALVDGF